MAKLVEIGGLIKKGLGHGVTERFSKNKDVVSVGYANGRASDIFDEQQFGSASEAEILTLIVKDNKSNLIFDELYNHLKLSKEKNGYIFKHESISKSQIGKVCPDIKATAFPTSNPLPPPKAITPSQLFSLKLSTPSLTFDPVGLPTTLEYNLADNLFLSNIDKVFFTISVSAKPLSVTNKGFVIFKFLQAVVISLILF